MNKQAVGDQERCSSCQTALTGRFCSNCGERRLEPDNMTVRHFFVHTVVGEVFNLDGRIWRTLKSLFFRPGFLSAEYCAGRRHMYVNPLRVYLTAIIAYALLTQGGMTVTLRAGPVILSIVPTAFSEDFSVTESLRRIDRFGVLSGLLAEKAKTVDVTTAEFRQKFQSRLESFSEPLAFANILLLAGALFLIFRRKYGLFVQHGVFSMHVMSFVLFSGLLFVPAVHYLNSAPTIAFIDVLVVILWQFGYLVMSLRRFYFDTIGKPVRRYAVAIVTALFIYILNSAFITVVQFIGGALALLN